MSKDAQLQLHEELEPEAAQLTKEHESFKAQVQAVINDLSKALDPPHAPSVETHLKTLNELMPSVASLVTRIDSLLERVRNLDTDDKALPALNKSLTDLHGRMERNYLKLKWLQDKAHDALQQARSGAKNYTQALAEMEAFMAAALKTFKARLEQMKALHELAAGSVQARDAGELAQLQRRNDERKNWTPTVPEVHNRITRFAALGDPKQLGKDVVDQVVRDRLGFLKTAGEIEVLNKQIDALFEQIKAMKAKQIDVKKAMAALSMPSTHEAKLKKALESGEQMERLLEALAKDLKLKGADADLLARLKKAKLI